MVSEVPSGTMLTSCLGDKFKSLMSLSASESAKLLLVTEEEKAETDKTSRNREKVRGGNDGAILQEIIAANLASYIGVYQSMSNSMSNSVIVHAFTRCVCYKVFCLHTLKDFILSCFMK